MVIYVKLGQLHTRIFQGYPTPQNLQYKGILGQIKVIIAHPILKQEVASGHLYHVTTQ